MFCIDLSALLLIRDMNLAVDLEQLCLIYLVEYYIYIYILLSFWGGNRQDFTTEL